MNSSREKPTEEQVREALAKVTSARIELSATEASWDKMRDDMIPEDVKVKIRELAEEMAPKVASMSNELAKMELELREMVAAYGQTVTGLKFQVVYISPKPVWNEKALDGYAAAHPDILQLKSMSEPKTQIRTIAKK